MNTAPAPVFIVVSSDSEGTESIERTFTTRAAAQAYADQFTGDEYVTFSARVIERPVETVAPRRYTNYSLVQMFSTDQAAASGRQIGTGVLRPSIEQFDEDDLAAQIRAVHPLTTEAAKVEFTRSPGGFSTVRAVGTDRAAVIAAFKDALSTHAAQAQARLDAR